MELCDFSLYDYIKYHNTDPSAGAAEIPLIPILSPAIVQKDCSVIERMKNLFTIVVHIARGLEFMHANISHAHRDLKPGNGNNNHILWGLMITVLYCRWDNRWKLTDFGISAQATSRRAHTTVYSKGTSSYRAPELLAEHAAFTNKVDIWALGCILHELATGRHAFHEDWAVREYFHNDGDLPISLPSSLGFFKHQILGVINDLLSRDWNQRPAASTICSISLAYFRLLDLSVSHALITSQSYPLYTEWKMLVENYPSELDFLSQLATVYERNGETGLATALQQVVTGSNGAHDRASAERSGGSIVNAKHRYGEVKLLEAAVELNVDNFWSWHNLSEAYTGRGDCDTAIRAFNQGNTRFPSNPWPVLALTNAYAAKGEFHEAILVYLKFFASRNESSIFDRLVSQDAGGYVAPYRSATNETE